MAASTRTRRNPKDTTEAATPNVFDLDAPTAAGARSRWPEITAGLFVVALFALAGSWFYASSTEREAVIALRNTVERGDVIDRDDLRVVQIDSDDQLNLLSRDESGLVIGRIALTDMAAGTLVTAEQFASGGEIESGTGIVGLALDPGEYPSLSIGLGDQVRVIEVPRPTERASEQLMIVESATVVDVGPIGVQNQLFISLAMPTEFADLVAAAAAQDRVRLIQVGTE